MNHPVWYYAILICLLISAVCPLKAGQRDTGFAANSIFLQALGKAGYGSVNYERLFLVDRNITAGIGVGLGSYNLRDFTGSVNPDLIVPVSLTAFYGSPHSLELSAGNTFSSVVQVSQGVWIPERVNRSSGVMGIGYRYMKREGGLLFRVAYNPVFEFYERMVHWGGVSIGYAF